MRIGARKQIEPERLLSDPPSPERWALRTDGGGIAWLTLNASSAGNLLCEAAVRGLARMLDKLEPEAEGKTIRALVLRSSHPATFCAGASAVEVSGLATARAAEAWSRERQMLLRRLELLSVPTVAAIDGSCVGAGAELVLACGYRIGSAASRTRLGFPQVRWGTLPAWGGTVRLPRLVGLQPALELILGGATVSARQAHQLGLLDEVFREDRFLAQVRRFTEQRLRRGRTVMGARRSVFRRLIEDTAPGRQMLMRRGTKWLRSPAPTHHPDAAAVLNTVARGLALPLDEAFQREAATFGDLALSPRAGAFLHVAAARETAEAAAGVDALGEPIAIHEAAVLGANPLGARIAHLVALHGIPVRLKEPQREHLARGLLHARHLLRDEVERGLLEPNDLDERQRLLTGTRGFGRFGTLDLVLEAVEDRTDDAPSALPRVAEHVRDDCLLAWTSALRPVAELQRQIAPPERVLGLHFFPVPRTGLVEVVRGPHTSPGAVGAAAALVRHLGKTPVVVRDVPGLVAFRLLAPYLGEAIRLVEQGVTVEQTDAAMREFGMAIGPLRLLDEIGLPAVSDWMQTLAASAGEHLLPPPLLARLVAARRYGIAARQGFYSYNDDGRRQPNAALAEFIARIGPAADVPAAEAIQQRLVLAMTNEAARVLDDAVVASAGEVDLVSVLGTGFPTWRGGILFYTRQIGFGVACTQLQALAEQHGDGFRPAPWLRRMAEAGAAGSGQAAATLL